MDRPNRVLIVDDERFNRNLIANMLKEDYKVLMAKNGEQALQRAFSDTPPDLILLDIIMLDMDGYEVCRRIKEDERSKEIPIIFITSKTDADDEEKGLKIGAIDYITKPFRGPIVKARVKNHLKLRAAMIELKRMYSLALDANPMTGLPGNNSVMNVIEKAISNESSVCFIYADLDNFKAYNDKYGFACGDEVIMFSSRTLKDAIEAEGCMDTFVGHIGGDDFVLVVPTEHCQSVANQIKNIFDMGILEFYNSDDAASRCIRSINRKGDQQTFPIISISMAGVDLSKKVYQKYIEVNDACAELKKKAKKISGSCFCMDQRL